MTIPCFSAARSGQSLERAAHEVAGGRGLSTEAGAAGSRRTAWGPVAGLTVLVVAVYARTAGFAFLNYDDLEYVVENPWVARGLTADGLTWALRSLRAANWHPLTWLSHMLDVEVFGLNPGPHHLVSVVLHLANTLLVFAWLRTMTAANWRSAVVAALFAVHPLHVESVAWISERKDVLSTLFWLLASLAWVRYVRRPSIRSYLLPLALFALGLGAKQMLVTLPFALLLCDVWPLGRLGGPAQGWTFDARRAGGLVLEKLPFLAISAGASAMTLLAQRTAAIVQLGDMTLGARAANAFVAYVAYLVDAICPAGLSPFYPHPAVSGAGTPSWQALGAVTVLAALTALSLRAWRRFPYLAWGWLWYLGTLVPVIGLVQVGLQARADRYTYLPLIGIFVAAVWGVTDLASWLTRKTDSRVPGGAGDPDSVARALSSSAAAAAILGFAVAAFVQVGYWRDSATLWSRAIDIDRANWRAWTGLGNALAAEGQFAEASAVLEEAVRLNPSQAEAWDSLGFASERLGRLERARTEAREAVRLAPRNALYWYNLGTKHGKLGELELSAAAFREATRLQPEMARAWGNLAWASRALGNEAEASAALRQMELLDPATASVLRRQLAPPR